MDQALSIFLPMLLFMLTPIFIPLVTSLIGRIHDRVTSARVVQSPAALATEAARQAAAVRRAETASANTALVG